MIKKDILSAKKEIVKKIETKKNKLIVISKSKKNFFKKYNCDIVVNVSGPLNAKSIKSEIPLVKGLKKIGARTISGNFLVNNYFEMQGFKNVFIPGILARGFNPERKTIISAILKNSNIVANYMFKKYLK
tara:strand:- start:979 stop:1368 length:390 start_codon:yes stop_codon:yes gene_type:complete